MNPTAEMVALIIAFVLAAIDYAQSRSIVSIAVMLIVVTLLW